MFILNVTLLEEEMLKENGSDEGSAITFSLSSLSSGLFFFPKLSSILSSSSFVFFILIKDIGCFH